MSLLRSLVIDIKWGCFKKGPKYIWSLGVDHKQKLVDFLLGSHEVTLTSNILRQLSPLSSSSSTSLSSSLLILSGSLSSLNFLDGSISLSRSNLGLDSSLLLDIIQTQTDNSSCNLVHTTGALLCGGLSQSLLVETTPCLGPYKLGRLFTLEGKGTSLGGSEEYRLSVTTDEKTSVSGVNSVFGKCTKLGC